MAISCACDCHQPRVTKLSRRRTELDQAIAKLTRERDALDRQIKGVLQPAPVLSMAPRPSGRTRGRTQNRGANELLEAIVAVVRPGVTLRAVEINDQVQAAYPGRWPRPFVGSNICFAYTKGRLVRVGHGLYRLPDPS